MAPGGNASSGHKVTLVGRPGCHLCAEARAVLQRVCAELGVALEERDLTDAPADKEYVDLVPVTLIDGVVHDFWRVQESRLRAALR